MILSLHLLFLLLISILFIKIYCQNKRDHKNIVKCNTTDSKHKICILNKLIVICEFQKVDQQVIND